MNRLQRFLGQIRSSWRGPLSANSPELARLFSEGPSAAGISVSADTALNIAAVWDAVNLISDDIASLPLPLYRRIPGGKERFTGHPLHRLIQMPNPEMSSIGWRRTMQAHVLLWGNGYTEVVRDLAGRPRQLVPITPDRVAAERTSGGTLRYRVRQPSGVGDTFIAAEDMLHFQGLGFDGVTGYSVISRARESLGLSVAAERFGATFFGNGASFGGVLSFPNPASPEVQENTRKALEARHGGVDRAHKFLTLYGGAKYERIGIPPNDAQFLETRVFQTREIARWFKIPPHKLADLADATFSNVEQQNLDYYTSCLRPWLEMWDQELTRKLVPALEQTIQFFEHVTEGLLKADAAGRAALYTSLFQVGAITPNEIRARENLNPVEGGDSAFVQANNLAPLSKITEFVDAQIAALKQPKTTVAPPDKTDTDEIKTALTELEQRQAAREAALVAETERRAVLEARHQDLAGQLVAAQQEAQAKAEALVVAVAAKDAEAERAARAAVEALTVETDAIRADLAEAQAALEASRTQAAEWQQRATSHEALITELRVQVTDVGVVREALGRAEAEKSTAAAEKAAIGAALAEARASLEQVTARRGLLDQALRALVVDAWTRVIQREVDRARKAQANPDKLRKHVDTFYALHEDTCREALRPAVRAWLAGRGAEAQIDTVLDRLVVSHLDEAIRALRVVAETDDAEAMPGQLERVLTRWEAHRAEMLTDRLVRETDYGH